MAKKKKKLVSMDQNWEAKHEARTLAEAEEIKADSNWISWDGKRAQSVQKVIIETYWCVDGSSIQ